MHLTVNNLIKKSNILIYVIFVFTLFFSCSDNNEINKQDYPRVIRLWAHEGQPDEKDALKEIIKSFNDNHDSIKIKAEFKQEKGYADRLNSAAIAKKLPDIIDIDGPYTAKYAEMGILSSIDNFLTDNIKDDFLPTIIEQGTYKGKIYTLGAFESTVVLFCNKNVLDSLDIEVPESLIKGWQWKRFVEILKKSKKRFPEMMPLETFMIWKGEWLTYAFTPLLWSNNAQIIEDGEVVLNNQNALHVLKKFQYLFENNLSDYNAPPGRFEKKEAAFAWGIFNRYPIYKKANIDFVMIPLPYFKKPVSSSGSWCWGISSSSDKKRSAYKVIEWLTHPKHGIAPICKANGGIPAKRSANKYLTEYVKNRKIFIKQLENTARTRPVTQYYGTITKEISRLFDNAAKNTDIKLSLKRASKNIRLVIKSESE